MSLAMVNHLFKIIYRTLCYFPHRRGGGKVQIWINSLLWSPEVVQGGVVGVGGAAGRIKRPDHRNNTLWGPCVRSGGWSPEAEEEEQQPPESQHLSERNEEQNMFNCAVSDKDFSILPKA